MLLQRAATLSLRTGAVRTALPRLARPLCMHDDFKPKTKAYASESGDDVHAQAWQHRRTDLPVGGGHAALVCAQIQKDIDEHKVVVFMKGIPDRPQCGFSNTVCQILKAEGASFVGFNVLADPDLRNGIKSFSNWPTIPQGAPSLPAALAVCSTVAWP